MIDVVVKMFEINGQFAIIVSFFYSLSAQLAFNSCTSGIRGGRGREVMGVVVSQYRYHFAEGKMRKNYLHERMFLHVSYIV